MGHTYFLGLSTMSCHAERTSSHSNTEVKQRWAMLVLGWVTAEEHLVLLATAGRFASPVIPCVWEAKITGHYWWSLLVTTAGWEVCISCNPVRLGGRGYITECDSEEYALRSCLILCGANEKRCLTVTVRRQSSC